MYRRILFKPDGDPAPPAGGGDPKPPDQTGDPTPPTGTGKSDPSAAIKFTPEQQEHIDSLVTKRVEKAEKAARQGAQQEAQQAADRAKMDETERLKAEKTDAEDLVTKTKKATNVRIVAAEAKVAALAAGAAPERIAQVLKLADLAGVDVGDDGEPDPTAVKAAIETVKKDLPELFGAPGTTRRSGGDFGQGNTGGQRVYTEAEIAAMTSEEYAKVSDDILAASREPGRPRLKSS